MTVRDFVHEVFSVSTNSPICHIPTIRRLSATAVNIRIRLRDNHFIDAFCNEIPAAQLMRLSKMSNAYSEPTTPAAGISTPSIPQTPTKNRQTVNRLAQLWKHHE